jgi:hypothetical protein
LSGGDLSSMFRGLLGLGLSRPKAMTVYRRARRAHMQKGGSLATHIRREARKELAKKHKTKRHGGSFIL